MDGFWKILAGTLVSAVLWLTLQKQEKEISLLLTLAVCCMGGAALLHYLQPVLEMLRNLETVGQLPGGVMGILLKILGTGLGADLAANICTDAGNAAMGKMLRTLGSGVILFLALPLFETLMGMVQELLGVI